MSNTPPPPDFAPQFPPKPSTPPKKSRTNTVIIGSAVAVIAAIVATGLVVVQSGSDNNKPAATAASSVPEEDVMTAAAEEPDPEPTYGEIDAGSFTIKLRTTESASSPELLPPHVFGREGAFRRVRGQRAPSPAPDHAAARAALIPTEAFSALD
ncbi:hypothetical protein [Streptomyces violarus]|uniref:hypothetical protein n=1 Tax=Streptomyces violarus TaxID=67380 RepID=UPI0021BE10B1|nr:hypothetical protein [Streptomyces violarus]MCT9145025.1 hypothetical protein [Streptomyces violarus]